MKYDARTCQFNMDTGCVELLLRREIAPPQLILADPRKDFFSGFELGGEGS